jgi:hypothetical protein
VESGHDDKLFQKLQKVVSGFDRGCITDDAYNKLFTYASNLDPKRLGKRHSHVAGVLAEWIQSVMAYSDVLRSTADDRRELRRLAQVLEHQYSEGDDDFEEVEDDDRSEWA